MFLMLFEQQSKVFKPVAQGALSVNAPAQRQRLYFTSNASGEQLAKQHLIFTAVLAQQQDPSGGNQYIQLNRFTLRQRQQGVVQLSRNRR